MELSTRRRLVRFLLPLTLVFVVCPKLSLADDSGPTERLVDQAMKAELAGQEELRQTLLTAAIARNPGDRTARWHLGFLNRDDQWLSVDQAVKTTLSSDIVFQYRLLREQHGESLTGQIQLARWCRANGLDEREKLHWGKVLQLDSDHSEAWTRLQLRRFNGQVMTKGQIDALKQAVKDHERALRTWGPMLSRLRREIKSSPSPKSTDAWKALSQISDPEAVPSLEKLVRLARPELQLHLVQIIGRIYDDVASDALVRLSLNSKESEVRKEAARNLSDHSLHAYAPEYLNQLESPIQFESALHRFGDQVTSYTLMRQERPEDVVNVIQSTSGELSIVDLPEFRGSNAYRRIVAREQVLQQKKIVRTERVLAEKNLKTNDSNERIFAALRLATGLEIGDRPASWWDWWKKHNEYRVEKSKPQYHFASTENRRRTVESPRPRPRHECFPAGTLIHTEMGLAAIETIKPGDRVLSRDTDSGELSYRLVTDTTLRQASPTMNLEIGKEHITATLGHPFWVVGKGWTMAKNLNPGDRLHGIDGSAAIDVVEGGPEVEAYNLIVDQTNSYFVSEAGFLVHDNLLRGPTAVPIPGWKNE